MNTIPVRVRIDASELVTQYLERVREGALAMAGFEHLGLRSIERLLATKPLRRAGPGTCSWCSLPSSRLPAGAPVASSRVPARL
jgi:hypothetical protein